jgi:hypothetical protein
MKLLQIHSHSPSRICQSAVGFPTGPRFLGSIARTPGRFCSVHASTPFSTRMCKTSGCRICSGRMSSIQQRSSRAKPRCHLGKPQTGCCRAALDGPRSHKVSSLGDLEPELQTQRFRRTVADSLHLLNLPTVAWRRGHVGSKTPVGGRVLSGKPMNRGRPRVAPWVRLFRAAAGERAPS